MQIRDLLPAMHWPWADKPEEQGAEPKRDDNPMVGLQREMNQMLDSFWRRFETPAGWEAFAAGAEPRSDVVETDKAIEVSVELPGMKEDDIEVSITDAALTIKGEKRIEKKEEKTGYYLSERRYGSVYRAVPLPAGVDADKAEAVFKDGVLTVTLPKSAEAQAKTRKISVNVG